MNIRFYLRFSTKPGQQLFICGNIPELGFQDKSTTNPVLMQYLNTDFWQLDIEIPGHPEEPLKYHFILGMEDGSMIHEWGNDRTVEIPAKFSNLQFIDTWNHAGEYENAFYTAPFQDILLSHRIKKHGPKQAKIYTHLFKVKAPLISPTETICISGSCKSMGDWSMTDPCLMRKSGKWWTIGLDLSDENFPISYKYTVYDSKHKSIVRYESGANRTIQANELTDCLTVLHDGFAHLPNNVWKGAGVSIPVFSLRSKNSLGAGEFSDIRLLVDWAAKTGLKLIQLLPINDTSGTNTWVDSYPYAAISAFALHPLYLNLKEMAGKKNHAVLKPLKKLQKQLNMLADMDYESVMQAKLSLSREIFNHEKEFFQDDPDFELFFENSKSWLVPYAAFCFLKESNGTPDFSKWKTYGRYNKLTIDRLTSRQSKYYDQISYYYFVQYHLHRQLKESVDYAHKNGIVLKGDIPIGVYRHSVDAWIAPDIYHMDQQAGAPPDDFAIKGQNWGFPTYNWQQMERDSFKWWKNRFSQMSNYFDAFRIDHILGFFRIWSIPFSQTEGIMGRFDPAIAIHRIEFDERNIYFNYDRYTKPFINEAVLWEYFNQETEKAKLLYFDEPSQGKFEIKPYLDTQRKVVEHFADKRDSFDLLSKDALLALISNVILFEAPDSQGKEFHFRIMMDTTSSFRYLDWNLQNQLRDLYINYFFRRQDIFWKKEAMKKLPLLKRSTNMLVCGEDLGMVPACVPDVMKQTGILSLEIQRMPKDITAKFFKPANAPYLSVVTPSTHDMSTIRGWWEENRSVTQKFFNEELGQWGEAPYFCDPWINHAIVQQNLDSPAMWSIFQIQDLFGIDENVRRENPKDERINIPSNPVHFWKYRIHLYLEDLLKAKSFNDLIRDMVKSSGR